MNKEAEMKNVVCNKFLKIVSRDNALFAFDLIHFLFLLETESLEKVKTTKEYTELQKILEIKKEFDDVIELIEISPDSHNTLESIKNLFIKYE